MNTFPVCFLYILSQKVTIFSQCNNWQLSCASFTWPPPHSTFSGTRRELLYICCCHHLQFNCLHDGIAQAIFIIQYTKKLAQFKKRFKKTKNCTEKGGLYGKKQPPKLLILYCTMYMTKQLSQLSSFPKNWTFSRPYLSCILYSHRVMKLINCCTFDLTKYVIFSKIRV